MGIWFTADTHFGHTKVITYSHRPFASVEEMDEELIRRWNDRIDRRDEVWHLGDFCFRGDPKRYFTRLNGRISFILGNHDHRHTLGDLVANRAWEVKYLRHEGRRFFLSHYAHRTWPSSHHGSYHLFGHSHGDLSSHGRSMDVGVDANAYAPVSLQEVVAKLSAAPFTHHHKQRVP